MGERVCDVDETIDANRGTHLVSADQRSNVAINKLKSLKEPLLLTGRRSHDILVH